MSYNPNLNDDSLSELISNLNDCRLILNKVFLYKNDFSNFINWFNKSLIVNKPATLKFIQNNFNGFNPEIKNYLNQFINNNNNNNNGDNDNKSKICDFDKRKEFY